MIVFILDGSTASSSPLTPVKKKNKKKKKQVVVDQTSVEPNIKTQGNNHPKVFQCEKSLSFWYSVILWNKQCIIRIIMSPDKPCNSGQITKSC